MFISSDTTSVNPAQEHEKAQTTLDKGPIPYRLTKAKGKNATPRSGSADLALHVHPLHLGSGNPAAGPLITPRFLNTFRRRTARGVLDHGVHCILGEPNGQREWL